MKCTFLYDIQGSRLILMITHRTGHTHHLIKHYKKVRRYRRLQAHRNRALLQSSTSSTTLSSGRVRWNWGNILNSANSQAGSGQGSQSGLTTWTWGLGLGTTSSSDLDVDSSDANLLTLGGGVLGSQHGGVWRGLVSVGLDLHTTGDSGDGFLTGEIGNVNEGIVERGEDTSNTKDLGAVWTVSI